MAELVYRKLYTLFWRDSDVRALPAAEKLIAVYILTGPQSRGCGIFAFSPGMAAEDTGLDGTLPETLQQTLRETFEEAFHDVVEKLGWRWDPEARVLYIPKWWKWNQPDNPNTLKGALGRLHEVPQTPLMQEFASNLEHLKGTLHRTFRKRLAEGYPKPSPEPSRNQRTKNKEQGTEIEVDLIDVCFQETDPPDIVAQYWADAEDWASLTFWGEPSTICHHEGKGPPARERVFLLKVARLVQAGYLPAKVVYGSIEAVKLRTDGPPRSNGAYLRTVLRGEVDNFDAMLAKVPAPPKGDP